MITNPIALASPCFFALVTVAPKRPDFGESHKRLSSDNGRSRDRRCCSGGIVHPNTMFSWLVSSRMRPNQRDSSVIDWPVQEVTRPVRDANAGYGTPHTRLKCYTKMANFSLSIVANKRTDKLSSKSLSVCELRFSSTHEHHRTFHRRSTIG